MLKEQLEKIGLAEKEAKVFLASLATEAADDSPTSGRNTSPLPHREEEYGTLFN